MDRKEQNYKSCVTQLKNSNVETILAEDAIIVKTNKGKFYAVTESITMAGTMVYNVVELHDDITLQMLQRTINSDRSTNMMLNGQPFYKCTIIDGPMLQKIIIEFINRIS